MGRVIRSKPGIILLLFIGVVVSASGYIDTPIRALGLEKVAAANDRYLDRSFDKAVTGFLILSGIKSGLAVLEGSEVGVGFNLELGDIVQSVYDYVDVAWKTALLGGTVILITRLMLQSAEMIDHWCLFALLFTLLSVAVIQWFFPRLSGMTRLLRETTFYLVIFSIVLYLILPLSITGAAFMSEKITGPLIQKSQDSFENIKEDLSMQGINRRIGGDGIWGSDSWVLDLFLHGSVERLKQRLSALTDYFQNQTRNIAIWTIQLIAGYLFDSIIFPITFFILLFIVAKSMLLYLFETRKQRSLREDVAAMVEKIYGRKPAKPVSRVQRYRPAGGPRKFHRR